MGLLDDFFRRGREGAQRAKGQEPQRPQSTAQPQTQARPQAAPAPQQPAPRQPGATAPQAAQRTYTVQAGDTLSEIALKFYGDAQAYKRIFDANRDILNDPNLIHPGQTLKLP